MFEEAIERRLRPLAAAFASSDLVRVRVEDGEFEVELRRAAVPGAHAPGSAGEPGAPAAEADPADLDVLTADLVGIVRFSHPVVKEGDRVAAGQELGSVEALGLRNQVSARTPGRVAVIYVEEGSAVDYGAPLFAIRRDVR
jgi:biotin carboxyl carrier protein